MSLELIAINGSFGIHEFTFILFFSCCEYAANRTNLDSCIAFNKAVYFHFTYSILYVIYLSSFSAKLKTRRAFGGTLLSVSRGVFTSIYIH